MLKRIALTLAALVAVVALSSQAYACKITFGPEEVKVDADGTATFKAVITWEHRKCVLADDDVTIDGTNVTIVKKGSWTKVKKGVFENELTIKLEGDSGEIRIWRECSKKGISEGIIKITK